jgi:DNA-binding transcriptional regulator YhcF (GntR family)
MAEEITLSDSSRVTARRQIATQIAARILSGELGAGRRLPSGRAMAQRLRVHRSVVAGAYRQLSGWGLVRTAGGSGVFVTGEAPARPTSAGSLRRFLEARRIDGSSLSDTADLLRQWMRAADDRTVLVVEGESALRSILAGELRASLGGVRIADISLGQLLRDPTGIASDLVVARRGLLAPLQMVLPPWVEVLPIRFRPANAELLASGPSPGPCSVALCTRSKCLGGFARGLLASAHGDRVGLLLVDPADRPAVDRARRICRWIFSDSACAPDLLATLRSTGSGSARVRVVRLVAPRFISELSQYLQGHPEGT